MADLNTTVGFTYSGTGLKQANADLKRVAKSSTQAAQGTDRLSQSTTRLSGRMRRLGPGIQNASFQLQDIIVQMQMGVPASRTLGQQLPQLLGGFGPLGAVLGLVAGGLAALVPLLFDSAEAGEDASDAMTTYKESLEAVAELKEKLNKEGRTRIELLEIERNEVLEGAKAELDAARVRMEAAMAAGRLAKDKPGLFKGKEGFLAQSIQAEVDAYNEMLEKFNKLEADITAAQNKASARVSAQKTAERLARTSDAYGFEDLKGGLRGDIAAQNFRREKLEEQLDRELELEERVQRAKVAAARRSLNARLQMEKEAEREMERAADTIGSSFERAFLSIIDGTKDAKAAFSDMAQSIIADIAKIVFQQSVSKPIGGFLGSALKGAFGGFFGGSAMPDATVGYYAQAKGGAWNGGVQMFAKGGVVGGPTMFGMQNGMGMMGEAGPEAVLPLKRGPGGNLGVEGTPPVVNVNIVNENGGEVETSQKGPNIEVLIKRAVAQDIKGGGTVYGAISKTFNIRPETTRRA